MFLFLFLKLNVCKLEPANVLEILVVCIYGTSFERVTQLENSSGNTFSQKLISYSYF